MTQCILESSSTVDLSVITNMGNLLPPRDPPLISFWQHVPLSEDHHSLAAHAPASKRELASLTRISTASCSRRIDT
jgi:hypothetical protein